MAFLKQSRPKSRIRTLVFFSCAVLVASCNKPLPPRPVESTRAALEARVGQQGSKGPIYCRRDMICGSDVLPNFYRARSFRPAWIDDDLSLSDAASFLAALRLVAEDGLSPENYHLAAIETLVSEIRAVKAQKKASAPPEALADLEMLLTDAFLLCGSHLVYGQVNPETIQSEWFIKGRYEDLAAALEKGLAEKDVPGALASLRPGNAIYRGLMKACRDYEAAARAGGWPAFPAGATLKKGDRRARVEALRNSLAALGDYAPPAEGDSSLFDGRLEDAVKTFQRRHGLDPDLVDPRDREAARRRWVRDPPLPNGRRHRCLRHVHQGCRHRRTQGHHHRRTRRRTRELTAGGNEW